MITRRKPLKMKIELTVIEDLGIKLYGTLPPVISEMVANAWDADASIVRIVFDEGDINERSKITVSDNGRGMSYEEIEDKYLRVGRKKRVDDGTDTTPKGRKVMGRKGIGKLSIFGIATRAEIKTIRESKKNTFLMDVDDMLKEAQTGKYTPKIISLDEYTTDKSGTTITLMGLKRKSRVDTQSIKRGIAKHFLVIGNRFQVQINGENILPSDKFNESNWEQKWKIDEYLSPDDHQWPVSGWIGATKQPLDEDSRGVIITARGKLIQKPTMFDIKSGGKFSYSYIAGEIRAEFFDMDEDYISTNRQSVIWETPQGAALKEWGSVKIKKISDEIVVNRRTANEKSVRENHEIKLWLESLDTQARKRADKIIRVVSSTEKTDEYRIDLMRYARASFEQSVFLEMVNALDEHPEPAVLLEVFKEWSVVEAREMERIVQGRLEAIKQLTKFVGENAREVPTLHNFFKKWPWVLEPTWTQWQHEVRFSKLLKEKFPDAELDEKDRRIDFVSIGVSDTVYVIELKRPHHSLQDKDFTQLAKYVGFVKDHLGTGQGRTYNDVAGYLVVGKRSHNSGIRELTRVYEQSRHYVRTYDDLISTAKRLHLDFEKKLAEFER